MQEYGAYIIARLTCVLIKLYRVAPESTTDSIWVLMPRRYGNNLDRFVECYATLRLRLDTIWWGRSRWWYWWWVLIGICRSRTPLLASLNTPPFIFSIVLELSGILLNLLKSSCRYGWIGSAVGNFTLILADFARISSYYSNSHEEC